MSSYQTVTLTRVDGATVTLEVIEFNPDQDVFSRVMDDAGDVTEPHDLRKAVAMMLCEYNGYDNAITAAATENEWGFDDGDAIVADVAVRERVEIGRSNADAPRYRAVLDVTLVDEALAASLSPATWDAAADPDGDLDEYFG
ncbi:MAG: hypothetical protein ABMB14_25335 [Myxococcota bacterium]